MHRYRTYLTALALLFAGCSKAPTRAPSVAPDVVTAELEQIERVGREIYLRDMTAAEAGDFLVANAAGVPEGWAVRGWLTVLQPDERRVDIIGVRDGQAATVLRVRFDSAGALQGEVLDPPQPLAGEMLGRWNARETAIAEHAPRCTGSVNAVAFPGTDEGWVVYLLPGTTDPDLLILGGHVRVWVGPGGEVRDHHTMTTGCMTMKRSVPPPATSGREQTSFVREEGAGLAAVVVSHVLDAHPREHHVFFSLLYGLPLVVVTKDNDWMVEKGSIQKLDREAAGGS